MKSGEFGEWMRINWKVMTIASLFPIVYVCVYDCKKHKVDF